MMGNMCGTCVSFEIILTTFAEFKFTDLKNAKGKNNLLVHCSEGWQKS